MFGLEVDLTSRILAAARRVILREGIPGLTLRGVAREAGVHPSVVSYRLTNKERLIGVVSARTGMDRMRWLQWACWQDGLSGWIPADPGALERERLWLAVSELGRTTPSIAAVVDEQAAEERQLITEALAVPHDLAATGPRRVGVTDVRMVHALLVGLVTELCRDPEAMPVRRARTLVDLQLELMGRTTWGGHRYWWERDAAA